MTDPFDPFAPPPGSAAAGPHGPPPPPPAGAPLYGEPPPRRGLVPGAARNGLGIAAFVVALLSVPFFWTLAVPLLALGLGVAARRRVSRRDATNGGLAVAALALASVTLLGGLAVDALLLSHVDVVRRYITCLEDAGRDRDAQQACQDQLRTGLGG